MSATIRKSVRVPAVLMKEVERLNPEGREFSKIATRALRLWVRRRQRRQFAEIIEGAARHRTPEQAAEDKALVQVASASGRRVLEKEAGRG